MIEIVLGWPPSDLSPNKRLHWAKLAAAKKRIKELERLIDLWFKDYANWKH